ncbi:murein DD-endopeptidase MepM/ murein hydrolase activator NlpD [Halospina denitrificans]|uniref:Murein DD-endopeptidase MepM/ murein hydrolase activator NlpD n=1 Tax=Halospina denitrificans TaxID=332522 RepID=A0A4R7JIY5_9GAMM|nr:M23 family metallopeptidase [Halospina denitrificans]TDT37871.1 murein DD-endopeptidase MepM/ murein hydrolase activator NlpD [Halospina denitrificans]
MNILLVGRHHGRARMLVPGKQAVVAVVIALASAVGGAAWGGYQLALQQVAEGDAETESHLVSRWRTRLVETRERLANVEERAEHEIDALTRRLGEIQARALRVDALGQNLVAAADMGDQEFNFDAAPAMGGPEAELSGENQSLADLEDQIDALDSRLRSREKQLALLDRLIANREINNQREPDGRPVSWGWTSSPYGYRTDPFTGRRAWHTGVDVAGRDGGDVVAVGAGVVTAAKQKGGYGYFVEIDHGDGLQTRYAHAKELLVSKGDIVEKGQQIAVMGSTGRSTGPHVHFEVVRNGNRQDPKDFM